MSVHDFDGDRPIVRYRHGGTDARARMRLHRGLRRLPRRLPAERTGVRDPDVRAGVSVRLAGRAVRHAAGVRGAHLRLARARLRAVQHAQPHPQPLLPPVFARRARRAVAGRAVLGGAQTAPRSRAAARSRHRSVDREEHRAAAQLRRRADALRPPLPRRRRGAHRAADRRQGPEPRGERRALSLRRPRRALSRTAARRTRCLLGARAASASGRRSDSRGG